MARIRTIKPEFFTSEDIVSMSPLARLFYVALWCESDRAGRLEWKPGTFKMRYLPGDDCDIASLSEEMTERGLIVLYEVDGKRYAEIPTFDKHQSINNREADSVLPRREVASVTRASRVKAEGKEGKGREGVSTEQPEVDSPPPFILIPLNDNTEFPVELTSVAEFRATYPAVNVEQELREMRTWSITNAKNRKTKTGVMAFINRWLAKEQDKAPRQGSPAKSAMEGVI